MTERMSIDPELQLAGGPRIARETVPIFRAGQKRFNRSRPVVGLIQIVGIELQTLLIGRPLQKMIVKRHHESLIAVDRRILFRIFIRTEEIQTRPRLQYSIAYAVRGS